LPLLLFTTHHLIGIIKHHPEDSRFNLIIMLTLPLILILMLMLVLMLIIMHAAMPWFLLLICHRCNCHKHLLREHSFFDFYYY